MPGAVALVVFAGADPRAGVVAASVVAVAPALQALVVDVAAVPLYAVLVGVSC